MQKNFDFKIEFGIADVPDTTKMQNLKVRDVLMIRRMRGLNGFDEQSLVQRKRP